MTKEKQNNIPKAKYPWVWECESRTLIFGELAIAAFLAFLLTSAHAALIQMEVCVVLLPIVIHLLMRAMTFAGLYIILRIKTTPDEFLVYCNLTSNDGKKRMMAAGVNADFIDKTDKKLTDVIERHAFLSIADRRVFQYT